MNSRRVFLAALVLGGSCSLLAGAEKRNEHKRPEPKHVVLDPAGTVSVDILNGPPETVSMRSGYVVLAPGRSVGKHSTKGYEESVMVLSGTGEMRVTHGQPISLAAFHVAYCPPQTEHNVYNTGSDTLRYIWLVAKAALNK